MITQNQFKIFVGCMFSSKTTHLLLELEKAKYQNVKFLAFKPSIDDRYNHDKILSHNGWGVDAIGIKSGADLIEHLSSLEEEPDLIAVDELFMLDGIADVLKFLFVNGKNIVVSSLDLSFQGKPFKEVMEILPFGTYIQKCTSICDICGKDAYYTHKKNDNDGEIDIGGSEKYSPRCFQHFLWINGESK